MTEWRAVVGHANRYEVSSDGEVRARPQAIWRTRGWEMRPARKLKVFPDREGYLQVGLRTEGGRRTRKVHHLVLEAFVGPRGPGQMCRHLDGNPSHNYLSNLQWGTILENAKDRRAHGTVLCGERHPAAKLTNAEALMIRKMKHGGLDKYRIADLFGIHPNHVNAIASGRAFGKDLRGK